MPDIDVKIEDWKNKLLDMGKRNRLLNYKNMAKSTLCITSPDFETLYEMLVFQERELVFPMSFNEEPAESGVTSMTVYGEDITNDSESYAFSDGSNIRAEKKGKELLETLRNIRRKARTAMEEQGINMLYLSFGFLTWHEPSAPEIKYRAPLILVPVSLTIESIVSPYVLRLYEDEIVFNPTLAHKLKTEYDITVPDFETFDSLGGFFEYIRSLVLNNNWTVSNDVGLSLLSFLKINMYEDLNKHRDLIIEHLIVRAIGGDPSELSSVPDGIRTYDFDKEEKPGDIFQILDADASQQEAILLAKSGVSFILQGPPGTGKSQTITNIIAECLAQGKKILFVSEKMAALDVVHKRLTAACLDDFCLVLHSYKVKKRSILDQLEKSLKLSDKKATLSEDADLKLDTLLKDRQELNDYAEQVFARVEPLGKSIYEANGIIASLEEYPNLLFTIPNIAEISQSAYNEMLINISRYASTIGKMTGDYKTNPWRGASLDSVKMEFRHDATTKLSDLLPKIKSAGEAVQSIFDKIFIFCPVSLSSIKKFIDMRPLFEKSYQVPSEWITDETALPLLSEVEKNIEKQNRCISLIEKAEENCASAAASGLLEPVSNDSLLVKDNAETLYTALERILTEVRPFCLWNSCDINSVTEKLGEAKDISEEINGMIANLLNDYESSVLDIDFAPIRGRIKTEYTSSFAKAVSREYKKDKKAIQVHKKEIVKKISDEEFCAVIEKLYSISEKRKWFAQNANDLRNFFGDKITSEKANFAEIDRSLTVYTHIKNACVILDELIQLYDSIEQSDKLTNERYKFLYSGISTDWEYVKAALTWAVRIKNSVNELNPGSEFIEKICSSGDFASDCFAETDAIGKQMQTLEDNLSWFLDCFESADEFINADFSALYERIDACRNNLSLLEEWIDFRDSRENCIGTGLEELVSAVEENDLKSDEIQAIFKKRFFRLWLDAILPDYPAVLKFRRKHQDSLVDEFASLDVLQFKIARARIRSKLINDLPSLDDHITSGIDEISILKKEINKKNRIMPIRKLFNRIPNLLLKLKPCLMMSPLSVSLFLEADSYQFDIVIFDEASQVYSENAIGAISRGRQVVIAGDSKQLPPTSFFQTTVSINDDYDAPNEDEEDIDDEYFKSILDEAGMLPERTLRWHYRSRHESLIAFSNAKIYKNNLITFPSNFENVRNNGVEFVYVPDGFYDRGGRHGNVIEAKKIAELVFTHFRETPERSLGVIAFGEVQQNAIETALREMRLENQDFEPFFSEDNEYPFFVKSLENVQGDERDTIIFSIGYAKDSDGVFKMQFGPLGKEGGERRLNVAITRAKYNVKLVGSILPSDINVESISTEGPKLLRAYMDYAINGASVLKSEIIETNPEGYDSPFEESVYNFLEEKGYKLAAQVGCSGYRIDIAVKHPQIAGVYVLGIECDGASYHSARTARERDRLRQSVLENMGWKFYRIWSTDWIKDPITEGRRLIDAIEDAIQSYGLDDNSDEITVDADDFVDISERNDEEPEEDKKCDPIKAYGFVPKTQYDFSFLPVNERNCVDPSDCLELIVRNEYPVHYEIVCQRMAILFGSERSTPKIRSEVDYLLRYMSGRVIQIGEFLYPAGYTEVPIRLPNERQIQHISCEELETALLAILRTCIGTTRDALCDETARVYGFQRTGPNIANALNEALDSLIEHGKVIEFDEKLRIL